VSSGGMEAAIWNANKVTELIAADKMGKTISLNSEYKPSEPLMKLMKPLTFAGLGAAALGALALLRKVFRR